ncbi:hypothetical protein I79_024123 [Cricetulus griseus]|uniref:Uncharacterized protein n=1 Tax=Cricetulus griseus TaxID=10029 RepID=G3IJT7_CRIGR|nr:hypothetical protein I79_024123 [Cricetulus griseus]
MDSSGSISLILEVLPQVPLVDSREFPLHYISSSSPSKQAQFQLSFPIRSPTV